MSSLPKHVIRTSSPWHSIMLIGVLCLIIAALSYYSWQLRTQQTIQSQLIETAEYEQHRQSQQQANTIGAQQQQLSQTSANARQKSQALVIQEATNEQLEKQLTLLQNQVLELEEELSFYQTVTQGKKASGLQIHKFQLFVDDDAPPNQFRYRLILTQGQRIESPLQGNAILQLPTNESNVLPVILAETNFKLRYVQVIEGYFTLTTDTSPEKVVIVLSQEGEPNRLQSFEWKLTESLAEN